MFGWIGPINTVNSERSVIGFDNSQFTVYNITAFDTGYYRCNCSNTQGRLLHSVQLLVEGETL